MQKVKVFSAPQERAQLGQLTITDHRDNPDHMVSCSAHKAGRRRKGDHSGPKSPLHVVSPTLLGMEWMNTFLPLGIGG